MSWVTDLWTLRPRLSIVVVGALIIIGLIKLTSLLPGKYYFNFSQLVSSDGSPFIVDPPGVTYQKLCAIIRNNKLADPKFAAEANCHGDLSDNVQPGSYGRANIDAIYRLVIGNDEAMRQAAQAVAKSLTVPPMPANDLRAAFQNSSDTGNTAGLISSYYRDQARTVVTADLQDKFAAAFEKLPQSADAGGTPDGDAPGPQSAQVQAAFIKAVQVTNADVAKPLDTIALAPITTKKIDEIVKFAGSAENVSSEVIAYYADQVGEAYGGPLNYR